MTALAMPEMAPIVAPRPRPLRYPDASTTELVAGLRRGDDGAWAELVRRYGGTVAAAVRTFRLNDADTQDAIQNTWASLFAHVDAIREPECLPGWLSTTARRECIRLINAHRREVLTTEIDAVRGCEAREAVSAEEVALRNSRRDWLRAEVERLSPRDQSLLRALWFAPMDSYAAISAATGMPIGSIGPTRQRILGRLRDVLERNGVTADA